ncbi:MAG TPA: class I SAM-dependent methyltransferase [Candidatus Acidoferrum sp.]|nr:class I SAM-dependent methyltransferase [Candidatus Acidoferrum sp.]
MDTSPLSCPACGHSEHRPLELIDVRDQHRFYSDNAEIQLQLNEAAERAAREYQISRCTDCGLEFADPMRAPSTDWYALAYRARELFANERWEFGAVMDAVAPGSRMLELGCGTGGFLKLCKQRNVPAVGVDFSSDAIAECRRQDLDGRLVDVCQPALRPGEAAPDHITAFHVLEHLERPMALFEQAAANASHHTTFWIAVPSDRRASRWLGEPDFLDQPPHHMTRWTEAALRNIGCRTNWVLENLTFEPTPIKDAAWTLSTRSWPYQALQRRGLIRYKTLPERAIRWAMYPTALLNRGLGRARSLTGFTMLARFRRG